ncbi:hypothetical protein [Nocardioides sp. AE5]|uniref:hypothetical protein n=1 Tax=Nocardioides sp. AE5 TaxID=2962573 RepID=UPI002881DC52|nr:hypothetical protein [Nocardioides sp. AE5]MDT0200471.1 hypothetical protein [Nocardioides sp. AE5]
MSVRDQGQQSLTWDTAVRIGSTTDIQFSEMRGLTGKNLARSTHQRAEVQHMLDEQAELAIADGDFITPEPRTACRAIATMCTSLPSWFRTDGPITPAHVARSYATYAVAIMTAASCN